MNGIRPPAISEEGLADQRLGTVTDRGRLTEDLGGKIRGKSRAREFFFYIFNEDVLESFCEEHYYLSKGAGHLSSVMCAGERSCAWQRGTGATERPEAKPGKTWRCRVHCKGLLQAALLKEGNPEAKSHRASSTGSSSLPLCRGHGATIRDCY